MSSYQFKARNKKTGEVVSVNALDDYLGLHQYGYMIEGDSEVLPVEVFDSKYEVVKINMELKKKLEKALETMFEVISIMKPESEAVMIAMAIPNLHITVHELIREAVSKREGEIIEMVKYSKHAYMPLSTEKRFIHDLKNNIK